MPPEDFSCKQCSNLMLKPDDQVALKIHLVRCDAYGSNTDQFLVQAKCAKMV